MYNSNERTGRYIMVLNPGDRYVMNVEARGFISQRNEVHAKALIADTRELPMDILMVPTGVADRLSKND